MHERKFPLFISLAGREVLLFGGGQVALRRARTLLAFGPDLTVIAPELDPAFLSLPVRLERRVAGWQPDGCEDCAPVRQRNLSEDC